MQEAILSRELVPENIRTSWGTDSKGRTIYGVLNKESGQTEWFDVRTNHPAEAAPQAEAAPCLATSPRPATSMWRLGACARP